MSHDCSESARNRRSPVLHSKQSIATTTPCTSGMTARRAIVVVQRRNLTSFAWPEAKCRENLSSRPSGGLRTRSSEFVPLVFRPFFFRSTTLLSPHVSLGGDEVEAAVVFISPSSLPPSSSLPSSPPPSASSPPSPPLPPSSSSNALCPPFLACFPTSCFRRLCLYAIAATKQKMMNTGNVTTSANLWYQLTPANVEIHSGETTSGLMRNDDSHRAKSFMARGHSMLSESDTPRN